VVTLLYNYFPNQQQPNHLPKIARYAYGKDYHIVVKERLTELWTYIEDTIGHISGRMFVDSAPVLERSWAKRSGLGWIGKNSNLLTRHSGSYFFIATIIIDLELAPDHPFPTSHCGSCTRCIDACPTDAIVDNGVVNAEKCISYQTIELKAAAIDPTVADKMDGWIFGCDICQEVCPWNRFSQPTKELGFNPTPAIMEYEVRDWAQMSPNDFGTLFKDTPLQRAKWKGLQRNIGAAFKITAKQP
jgi:epoxyqueuosine reductase